MSLMTHGEMIFVISLTLILRASATSFASRDSRSDPPGLRSYEPSRSQIHRGRTPAFMRRGPRWVARCFVHVSLRKPPQPTSNAKEVVVPERKVGFEALEASAKVRISSIDCLSAASFEAARSEQLRLPAEEPLKRRDGNFCGTTLFAAEACLLDNSPLPDVMYARLAEDYRLLL